MSSNRGHRAGQCAPEVPRTRIRARGDLLERCTRPGAALSPIGYLHHGQGVDYLQYHEIVNFLGKQVIYTIVKTIIVYPEIMSIFVS